MSSKVWRHSFHNILVIRKKEFVMGRDDPNFVSYVFEIVKVFN